MDSGHEAEIRASVGAHNDLGPGYDDALAEGLVERIGAEIDKRIQAQLRRYAPPFGPLPPAAFGASGAAEAPAPPDPAEPADPVVPLRYPAAGGYPGYLPGGYHGYPGYLGYPGYPGYQAPLPPPGPPPGYPPPGYPPPGYPMPGSPPPGYPMPGSPPPGYPMPATKARPTARSAGQRSVAMTVIALGSMTLGVAATAIVAHAQNGGKAAMALLIWAVIAIVNVAYARRC
jgi:hypothetical protein